MKQYPSISERPPHGTPLYIFDKLDGSNVRAEWSRKGGWYKFGRRHGLLDDTNPLLRDKVPGLILGKYADDLTDIFRKERWDRAIAYFEFHGPNSFAGNHEDEEHTVTLFDVSVHRKGILEPRQFLKLFGDLDIPTLLHHGNFTQEMKEQVEEGTLEGMTYEGIVAKGPNVSPGRPFMAKWKNYHWLRRLKEWCNGDLEKFNRLR